MRGELATEEPYGIEQTYEAARQALESLKLNIIEDQTGADAMSARVTARDSADTKIYVRLKAITDNATRVFIQVGAFGDETKTRRIQEAIRECLKTSAAVPETQDPASATGYVVPLPIPMPMQTTPAASTSAEPEQPASAPAEPADPAAGQSTPTTP